MTIRAAGILCLDKDGKALFLKRGPGGDHPGEWCIPGGHLEPGETAEQAARREWEEEVGSPFEGDLVLWARRIEKDHRNPFGYAETLEHVPRPGGDQVGPGQPGDVDPQRTAKMEPPVDGPDYAEDVDFTTFIAKGYERFSPEVEGEHTGYAWATPNLPPEPLHPGVRIALAKLTMNELDIAKAMSEGDLASPQYYENVALFDIRVTGTGTAYRKRLDEYAYRPPEDYLTPEFLARCNGLPVILEHPVNKSMLDTKEFNDRVVGSIFVPYLKGDEVWGIAKIHDMPTARMMEEKQLSTSPSVVFRNKDINTKVTLEDGSTLLIEGKPSLLDHLAICEQGVWDKGGDPVGVVRGDSVMTEEEKLAKERADKARRDAEEKMEEERKDKARKDAEARDEKLDKILSCLDSISSGYSELKGRMDSMEKGRKDDDDEEEEKEEKEEPKARKDKSRKDEGEEGIMDKGRKDSKRKDDDEEETEEEEREERGEPRKVFADKHRKDDDDDAARKDSVDIRTAVADAVRSVLPRPMTDDEYNQMTQAQAKADQVFAAFGDAAPRPLSGENLQEYRCRLASGLQKHSGKWKTTKLNALSDDVFTTIESEIYNDAQAAAQNPTDIPALTLREVQKRDRVTGRVVNEFFGDPDAWMGRFKSRSQSVMGGRSGFKTPNQVRN